MQILFAVVCLLLGDFVLGMQRIPLKPGLLSMHFGRFKRESLVDHCRVGSVDGVKRLVLMGVSPALNEHQCIKDAASFGYSDLLLYLVNHGEDPSMENNVLLVTAATEGWLEIVQLLLKMPKVQKTLRNTDLRWLIQFALANVARSRQLEREQVLIEIETFAFKRMLLAIKVSNAVAVKELLGRKFDTTHQPQKSYGLSSLLDSSHFARLFDDEALVISAQHGCYACTQLLLEFGCPANARNNRPIVEAALRGFDSIVKLLVDHGADPLANAGEPLVKAIEFRQRTSVDLLLSLDQVKAYFKAHQSLIDYYISIAEIYGSDEVAQTLEQQLTPLVSL